MLTLFNGQSFSGSLHLLHLFPTLGLAIGYAETFVHQVADFIQGLSSGKMAAPTFKDGLATDYVTDAVLKSAKTGRWEKVKKTKG